MATGCCKVTGGKVRVCTGRVNREHRHRDTHVCAAPGFEPSYKQSTEDARRLLAHG